MSLTGLLIALFVLWLIFGHPGTGFGQRVYPGYGYPVYGGGIGLLLVVLLVLWLLGFFR